MNKQTTRLIQKKQKALKALQVKNLSKAKKLLKEVCKKSPRDGQGWFLLSNVYGQEGNFAGVVKCCDHALASGRKDEPIYSNLGNSYAALGRSEDAVMAFEKALELSPNNPTVLHNLGTVLLLVDREDEAIKKFQQAITLQPNYAKAHYCLARAFESTGQLDLATSHYHTAVQHNPQFLDAHLHLGGLLAGRGLLEQAEAYYNHTLETHPNSEQLFYRIAKNLQFQGRYGDSLTAYGKGLQIKPDDPEGIAGEAEIYERQGEYEEAYKRICLLIEQKKADAATAAVYLKICRRYERCDEAIELANGLLSENSLDKLTKKMLYNSLGGLYDKSGDFDTAFTNFAKANAQSNLTYDAAEQSEKIDRLIAAFRPEVMAKIPRSSINTSRPIFIIGMPRSGTTLAEQIIASHPKVFGGGELGYIRELIRPLPPSLYPKSIDTIEQGPLDGMAKTYLHLLEKLNPDAQHVTDKMPGNFRHLGLISLMFPSARVIHCVRDPLDTCLSIFFQNFNLAHTYATKLTDIGAYYKEYQRLMAHWKAVLDLPVLEINYGELVNDQERLSRSMIEFCGLEWDENCLHFHKNDRAIATASYDQVRKPIYKSSLARWKNYEKHLGPLRETLGI